MFTRYIRELLSVVSSSRIGCHIGGAAVNIFAYADDIVLLAPAWPALQELILLVSRCCQDLGLTFNVKKSKCMIINPVDKKKLSPLPSHSLSSTVNVCNLLVNFDIWDTFSLITCTMMLILNVKFVICICALIS